MGTLIGSGIGSGLDIAGLVSQLVAAEGRPQSQRLDLQEAKAQSKISALGTLRSALSGFQTALDGLKTLDDFRGRTVKLGDDAHLSATASSSAVPGSYQIEVQQLATAHKLASAAYATADEAIGTGTLTLTRGAESFAVEVTAENNTLAGIAAAINDATDNPGVAATIVNGVDGAQLVLSAIETGAANSLVVTQAGGDGGLEALVHDPGNAVTNLTQISAARNARALIDGIAVESDTNSVTEAVEGLSIQLLAENEEGESTSMTVAYDREGARGTIDKLVSSYNGLVDSMASVASFDPATSRGGPLFGDAGLRNLVYQLRRELTSHVEGPDAPFQLLSQIGISTEINGKLSVDTARLDAAFAEDFDAVGQMFAHAETGVAARLDGMLEPYVQSGGVLDSRSDGYKRLIDNIGDQREALELRLQSLESRLFRQFNALDGLLAEMQSTSNFLAQGLSQLPGFAPFKRDND